MPAVALVTGGGCRIPCLPCVRDRTTASMRARHPRIVRFAGHLPTCSHASKFQLPHASAHQKPQHMRDHGVQERGS